MIERRTLVYVLTSFSLSIVLSLMACSLKKGSTEPLPYDVNAELNRGWSFFQSGEFDNANEVFAEVLSHSWNNPEAHLGSGWCYAFLGKLQKASAQLILANESDLATPDADMGLAVVYRDMPDYSKAIDYSNAVLAADSTYSFSKRPSIDYKDAHLIKAVCYFGMGSSTFQDAHKEINFLCGILGLPLLPDYDSVTDDEYEKQMAQKLERISEIIGE